MRDMSASERGLYLPPEMPGQIACEATLLVRTAARASRPPPRRLDLRFVNSVMVFLRILSVSDHAEVIAIEAWNAPFHLGQRSRHEAVGVHALLVVTDDPLIIERRDMPEPY